MLPGMDGFGRMDYIRPKETPVIFITARNSVSDKVQGLKMGADDYIVKPFEIVELLARVESVLRRNNKLHAVIEIGGLSINTKSMIVSRDGQVISLTRKEYDIIYDASSVIRADSASRHAKKMQFTYAYNKKPPAEYGREEKAFRAEH